MPVYKKKSTSAKATLSWDGYAFPWNTEVETNKFVLPHADLELISDAPLPPIHIMVNQAVTLDGTTPITVDVPDCAEYAITIRGVSGTVTVYPNVGVGIGIRLEAAQTYYNASPIARGNVVRWVFTATEAAACTVLMERVK